MAVEISYPGVYIDEKSSGIHPIEGVPTSITAFVGRARGGPLNDPVLVHGFVEFERAFDGPSPPSTLDDAVRLFFENGGRKALIVRVGAKNGRPITDADISAPRLEAKQRGLWALDKADLVNLLCIPPLADGTDTGAATRAAAIDYCRRRQALFIADPSVAWKTAAQAVAGLDAAFPAKSSHAALFFPHLQVAGARGRKKSVAPCGAVAGVMARIDNARGVWKAPAGVEATLGGVSGLAIKLTDSQNGKLSTAGDSVNRLLRRY